MIKYNEKTVSIGYINEDLIIRGEMKNKEYGLKLNSTSLNKFNKLKNINKSINDLDKYTFKEVKDYLDKNNIEYEKVEFV